MSDKNSKPNFAKVLLSVCAAAFGVQKRENLEADFKQSSPMPFIAAGIIFTVVFVLTLVVIVKIVLAAAGV